MEKKDLDFILLSQIRNHIHRSEETIKSRRPTQKKRMNYRLDYFHENQKICRDTFMFMHAVFKDRLTALISHYIVNGVTERVHGGKGKQPKHALTPTDMESVVCFITNYAEQHAVLLPGRIPGYKRDDLKLLPSSISKAQIHRLYSASCATEGLRVISENTFYRLWKQYVPYILPMKPMSDLCLTCQQNSNLIVKAANRTILEKTDALKKAEEHLFHATTERSFYNVKIQECRDVLAEHAISDLQRPGNSVPDLSSDFEVFTLFTLFLLLLFCKFNTLLGPVLKFPGR